MTKFLRVFFFAVLCIASQLCNAQDKSLSRPQWVKDFPMVFVGNWDIKPTFRTRVGGNPLWQPAEYEAEHTEERVKKFKDMGATMVMLHFYKGFGLEAEKEERENAIKIAQTFKKYGIKVGVYIGSTVAYESFLLETPKAKEWFPPEFMGLPVTYGSQTFRKLVYFQHEDYKTYMKRVLKIAIEDLKADLIHFDNSSIQAIPPVFYHPQAAEDFRNFLRKKYTPEMLKKRFGFSEVTYVEPPKYNRLTPTINDPMIQEWTDFRCQQLADYYGEMETYIRGLNPEVAVECNPHGLSGNNTMVDYSVDFPRLLAHTDFFWTEGEETGLAENGVLLSKIRTFKMASTLKNRVFTNVSDSKIKMAESMAYNRQGLGMIGGTEEMEGAMPEKSYLLSDDQRAYINFFKKNFDCYKAISNVADVAILHSYNSMANNSDRPYASTFLFEQSLIQGKIPFDIIFDDQLNELSKYKVLVLADQECLNDNQLQLVRNFVKNGGGLVATEHTSLYNEWHLRKPDFGLKDLFQIAPPEWHTRSVPEDILEIAIQKSEVGKGKVVYIPEVKPAVKRPAVAAVSGEYLKLASNHNELIDAVKWASGNQLSLHIDAPLSVTMELNQKTDESGLILHLINFDSHTPVVKDINVTMKMPQGKKIKELKVLTPDGRSDEILKFKVSNGELLFTVPQLTIYNIIKISF